MDQFETEEQQVEAIKRFWKENGLAIVAGAAIGLGGLWSWRYYTDSQIAAKETASIAYQEAVDSIVEDESNQSLTDFVSSTESSGYKSISGLVLAQRYVNDKNLDGAIDVLQDVMVANPTSPLATAAAVRIAKIQLHQSQFENALKTLDAIAVDAFEGQVSELKGDALVKLGRFDEAKQAYITSLDKTPDSKTVQMKLDNLAIASGV